MNYYDVWLQNQMLKQQSMEQQGMPPPHNPAIMAAATQPMPQRNPVESGALSAIGAVKHSLMEKPQSSGILGDLGQALGRTVSRLGVAGLRASASPVAQHLGNSMMMPEEREQQNLANNMQIMQHLAQQEAHEREMQHKEAKLAEERRHHDMLGEYYRGMGARRGYGSESGESGSSETAGLDLSGYSPIVNKSEYNRLSKAKHLHGNTLYSVREASKRLDELEAASKGDWFKPTDPVSGGLAQYKNNILAASGMEGYQKVRNKTKLLNDSLTSIRTAIEQAKKGGVPGEQMMKRWEHEGILPHMRDSTSTIREKLKMIDDELSAYRDAADLSLKSGRHIDAIDMEEIRKRMKPAEEMRPSEEESMVSSMSTEELEHRIRALEE